MADVPRIFRVTLQVASLTQGVAFYSKLLGQEGRPIHGARHYFDCGPVILALLDPTGDGSSAKPNPDYLYLTVGDIEPVHARASELGCLSTETVHGESGGKLATRPWGERSFYVVDPFGNLLCFVEAGTEFIGC